MTVMDKVEGWNEEKWVGSKFAECLWIYTQAVLCDGHRRPPQDLRQMLVIITECVSWVCEDALCEHEWVMEPNVLWKENDILEALNYDRFLLCPLQWDFCGSMFAGNSVLQCHTEPSSTCDNSS